MTKIVLTYEDFVSLPDDGKRYELHEGELSVTPAPGTRHQDVLLNLTLNALDVMPHGGTLTIRLRGPEHGWAELSVHDSGPGIAAAIQPRLFEPFVSDKETGLGLGLSVSRRIVEDHGGTLRAHNRPEGGACFVVRLPAMAGA